ncbi:hypothetical protein ACOSP7_010152 [Xanthoceras sorbifolium]
MSSKRFLRTTSIINHIHQLSSPLTEVGLIIDDIRSSSEACRVRSFSFVQRATNRSAHSLAQLACSFPIFSVWIEDIPSSIVSVVLHDCRPFSI